MADKQGEPSIKNQDQAAHASHAAARFFQIRVKGHLNSDWGVWLEGLEMTCLDNGEMLLSGAIEDQAALMGVLAKLHRLNLAILSVNGIISNKIAREDTI